jgi:hypothetical protein
MENIKLHASPHPAESSAACPEVWDTEGESRDLAVRRSLNLRRQNLRRPAERHRHPAAGRRRPVVPPPPSCSSSPSSFSANRPPSLSNNLQLRVNK